MSLVLRERSLAGVSLHRGASYMHNGRFLTFRQVLEFCVCDNADGVILGQGEVWFVR
jgi:hypothetical protein